MLLKAESRIHIMGKKIRNILDFTHVAVTMYKMLNFYMTLLGPQLYYYARPFIVRLKGRSKA